MRCEYLRISLKKYRLKVEVHEVASVKLEMDEDQSQTRGSS